MKIYVASSWRNLWQPGIVSLLQSAGHEVYDFRHPKEGDDGFSWSEIDPAWKDWTPYVYREALKHPLAEAGFSLDMNALRWCDACVLVQPCGNSSHLELGWACGAGKRGAVYFPEATHQREDAVLNERLKTIEPELMVKMAGHVLVGSAELLEWCAR